MLRKAHTFFLGDPPCGRFLSLPGRTGRSEIHEPLYFYQPQKRTEVAGIYHRDVKLENLMFRGRTSGPMAGRKVSGRHCVFGWGRHWLWAALVVAPKFSATESFHLDKFLERTGKSIVCWVKSRLFGAPFDE